MNIGSIFLIFFEYFTAFPPETNFLIDTSGNYLIDENINYLTSE